MNLKESIKTNTKYIFVTGGVVSSLGKGIAAASIGTLLESRGINITLMKLDPYINVDPGTMSPYQHGEVFVTEDGAETDLDLGHYERFTSFVANKQNNFTTGQVYDEVIQKERKGAYLGKTVQVIPHITNQIKSNILSATKDAEVAIIEIGGTVGDIESLPFLESIRQFSHELEKEQVMYIHLTLIPYISSAEELKTKPTQHSVNKLREIGIQPNILLCRSEQEISLDIKKKIALFTNVNLHSVITAKDVKCIYEVPLYLHKQGLDEQIVKQLNISCNSPQLDSWLELLENQARLKGNITIGIIGKYTELKDSYKSLHEALEHAAMFHHLELNIEYINTDQCEDSMDMMFKNCDGILIPGGFGERGIEGKIKAIQFARENKIPFFGICLGLQMAVIEYARNIANIHNATSAEFNSVNSKKFVNIIDLMDEQKKVLNKGATMRLGAYPAKLKKGSKIESIYKTQMISERHRHRFEVNNKFISILEEHGLSISGINPKMGLVESIEIKTHPWFIAVQFHPEFKSKPTHPHPLFESFVHASFLNS